MCKIKLDWCSIYTLLYYQYFSISYDNLFSSSGDAAITPYEFVTVEFIPEVPVPGEPTLVTCTVNVPGVQSIRLHYVGVESGFCTFNILDNQIECTDYSIHVSIHHKQGTSSP